MSRLPEPGKDEGEDELPHGIIGSIGIRREFSLFHHGVPDLAVLKCKDDIVELREQLDSKDEEISSLRKRVKDLEVKNNDLELQLQNKCNEVQSLKNRIEKLEDEKKSLQQQLAVINLQLKDVEEVVGALTKSKDEQDEKNVKLEGKMQKIQLAVKELEGDLKTTKQENKSLKAKVKQVQNDYRYVQGAQLRLPVPADDQNNAMVQLAELSCQIQDIMYQKVLPRHYTPVLRYTIKSIEKDIQRLPKNDADRQEAISRWEKLKSELNWDDDKTEVVDSLRESRTVMEPVAETLNERGLRECTNFLEEEGILKGWLTIHHLTGLIDAWSKLKSL